MPFKDPLRIKEYQKQYRDSHRKSRIKSLKEPKEPKATKRVIVRTGIVLEENLPKGKEYYKRYQQKYYLLKKQNPANVLKWREQARLSSQRCRKKTEHYLLVKAFKAKGCLLCSETDECCLSAHHLDKTSKLFTIAEGVTFQYPVEKLKEELAKCICTCENCHRKIHAGRISQERIEQKIKEAEIKNPSIVV